MDRAEGGFRGTSKKGGDGDEEVDVLEIFFHHIHEFLMPVTPAVSITTDK